MNDQNFYAASPPEFISYPKPKNEYTALDSIMALLSFPLAFAFVRATGAAEFPLGRLICSLLLFILSAVYLKKHGVYLTAHRFSFAVAISALLLSLGLIMTSNGALQSFLSLIVTSAYIYWVFAATGNSAEKCPNSLFPLEMLKAAIVMPFGSIACAFEALANTKKSKKIGKTLLLILAGLALAFIPTLIVVALLSYDESFRELTAKLLDFGSFDIFRFIADLIFALPIALLLFGVLYSGRKHRFENILTAEKCQKVARTVRFVPTIVVCSAAAPFAVIYSIFFVSQLNYYLSAFGGVLPEGLSYASYARNGFFELCAVSAINAMIILCVSIFCRKKQDDKAPAALKAVNIILSIFTLILIATAISKMVLYIGTYGLTVKRVLASAFMIFLGIVFIALTLKQFVIKTNVILTALITAVLITAALTFTDVNGVIASYNTDRYLEGTLEKVDLTLLCELGDSGVLQLHRIAQDSEDIEIKTKANELLKARAEVEMNAENSVFSLTVPHLRAKAVLQKYSAND